MALWLLRSLSKAAHNQPQSILMEGELGNSEAIRRCHTGVRTWPPVWIREFGPETYPARETGILEDVLPSIFDNECYLVIEHYGSRYRGLVHCDNAQFFSRLYRYLRDSCGHPIREIGEIEVDNLHAV